MWFNSMYILLDRPLPPGSSTCFAIVVTAGYLVFSANTLEESSYCFAMDSFCLFWRLLCLYSYFVTGLDSISNLSTCHFGSGIQPHLRGKFVCLFALPGHKYLNTWIIPIQTVFNSIFQWRICTNCILAILLQSLYSVSAHWNTHLAALINTTTDFLVRIMELVPHWFNKNLSRQMSQVGIFFTTDGTSWHLWQFSNPNVNSCVELY